MRRSSHRTQDTVAFQKIADVIRTDLAALSKPGVISARPGYKAVGGWLTRKPAIVVTVRHKADPSSPNDALPIKLGGFPVDVREATPAEVLRTDAPQRFSELAATGRAEARLPAFDGELQVESGSSFVSTPVPEAFAARAAKPEIAYTAPAGVSLDPVTEPMALICHASPDAGWPQLKAFFGQIQSDLTVGMYDFTSAHILSGLTAALAGNQELTLTLDHPPKNATADQTDEQTVTSLENSLQSRLAIAWALVRSSPKAPEWIYPSAYHIKVAVRDSSVFWLSSGNWNNSNQPDIDPLQDPGGSADIAAHSDRDWHVIVENETLAKTYQAFLRHDFDVANQVEQGGAPSALLDSLAAATAAAGEDFRLLAAAVSLPPKAPVQYFPPLRIPAEGTRNIALQPVLTPDNYHDLVLPLIQGAQRTFYMQTQYMHPATQSSAPILTDLIDAVIALQQRAVDVRIILSEWQLQGGWLDKLQAAGVDLNSVKVQNGVHNKAIVVDSQTVMLGSQNWSGEGVSTNRDASLIIADPEAARYYEQIFLHDWVNMAVQSGVS